MNIENKKFISWFFKRLKYKYNENSDIVSKLGNFISENIIMSKKIDTKTIDLVCKRFYPDFDIERVPDIHIGFNEKERNHLRSLIVESIKELSKK